MIRRSIVQQPPPIFLMPGDKSKCRRIANFVMVQCILVFLATSSILECVWEPSMLSFDTYKLACIMYLYDKQACGYAVHEDKVIANLKLSNDTRGFNVRPIRWTPAIVTVSTRLSYKTRKYIELSVAIHVIWMLLTIAFKCIVRNNTTNSQLLRYALFVFFSTLIIVTVFDLSMGIVYVTHIKQSLTAGMIVRYSGWSGDLKLKNFDNFAGYLPMIASACWVRGVVILGLNIYCCKIIHAIQTSIKSRVFMTRVVLTGHQELPEARDEERLQPGTLYYRAGENRPYGKSHTGRHF